MSEQTIYSYTLLRRFRWGILGALFQLALYGGLLSVISVNASLPWQDLFAGSAVVLFLPPLQVLLFRLYAFASSQPVKRTTGSLLSPWWGAGTDLPAPLSFFRGAEAAVLTGSLLVPAALYVWLSAPYAWALLAGAVALSVPRILLLLLSVGKPKQSRVRYSRTHVDVLLTEG